MLTGFCLEKLCSRRFGNHENSVFVDTVEKIVLAWLMAKLLVPCAMRHLHELETHFTAHSLLVVPLDIAYRQTATLEQKTLEAHQQNIVESLL